MIKEGNEDNSKFGNPSRREVKTVFSVYKSVPLQFEEGFEYPNRIQPKFYEFLKRKEEHKRQKDLIVKRFYRRAVSTRITNSSEKYLNLKYSNDALIPRRNGTPQYKFSSFESKRKVNSRSARKIKRKINFEIKGGSFIEESQPKDVQKNADFSFAK